MRLIFNRVVVRIFLFVFIFLGAYFILVLQPALKVPRQLRELEEYVVPLRSNITQSRVSYVELIRLETSGSHFVTELNTLISSISDSNKNGVELLDGYEADEGFGKAAGLLDTLELRHRSILEDQQKLIDEIKDLYAVVLKLLEYDPQRDLIARNGVLEIDLLRTRVSNSAAGLRDITSNLDRYTDTSLLELQILLVDSIQQLDGVSKLIAADDENDARERVTDFVVGYQEVRGAALVAIQGKMVAQESIELLTRQAQLIEEYGYLLEEINMLQQQLLF